MDAADQSPLPIMWWTNYASGSAFCKGDPGPLLESNYTSYMRVRKMLLQLPDNVEKLGDSIEKLTELTHLYISFSNHLKCLPNTITKLHKLEELSVLDCKDFQCPSNLDQFVSLRHLSLQVSNIRSLPDSMFKLSNLETLDIRAMSKSNPFTELPENLDQLISLRCLSLFYFEIMSVPHSIAKLSHLETLNLHYSYFHSPLPETFKLLKLTLRNSCIYSLPTRLCHLEIDIFSEKPTDIDILDQHFSQSATLETLSISCYNIKFLPSITGLHNLRELILNTCFNLRELPANLNELVNLSTLNIIGSRIKSVPSSITKLHNLRELILKGCSDLQELPVTLDELVKLSTLNISGTKIKSLPCSIMKLPNLLHLSLPECFRLETLPNNLYESVLLSIDGMDLDMEYSRDKGNASALESTEEVRESISEEPTPSINTAEHTSTNEPLKLPDDSQVLEESYCIGRKDAIHGNSDNASSSSQNEVIEILPSGNEDSILTSVGEVTMQSYQTISRCKNITYEGQSDFVMGKKQKIEFTVEDIQPFLSKNMRLIDAAKELHVTRSTMKRRLRKLGIEKWPSSRIGKSQCANKRKLKAESSSESKPAWVNLVKTTNTSAGHEHLNDANECNGQYLTAMEIVEEPRVATQCHSNYLEESPIFSKLIVKAAYKDDTVRFELCLIASFHELEKEVAKNLKLELGKFKIKYQDEDKDWMLMTTDSHLKYVFNLSKSSDNNIVRLSIFDL